MYSAIITWQRGRNTCVCVSLCVYETGPYALASDGIAEMGYVPEPTTFVLAALGFVGVLGHCPCDRKRYA